MLPSRVIQKKWINFWWENIKPSGTMHVILVTLNTLWQPPLTSAPELHFSTWLNLILIIFCSKKSKKLHLLIPTLYVPREILHVVGSERGVTWWRGSNIFTTATRQNGSVSSPSNQHTNNREWLQLGNCIRWRIQS